jgi:hypothetical protein
MMQQMKCGGLLLWKQVQGILLVDERGNKTSRCSVCGRLTRHKRAREGATCALPKQVER